MKNITATIIALAMLLGMASCNGGTDVPAGTTAGSTTAETTASAETTEPEQTAASVTTEATEEVTTSDGVSEGDISSMLEGYELHEMSSEELEDFRNSFPEDSALGNLAIEVTDYSDLYLLIEDKGVIDGESYYRANVHRVICGDVVQDVDVPFVFGPEGFGLLKTEEYIVVSRYWYDSYHYIFHKDGCTNIPIGFGRDGGSPSLYVEDGVLKYTMTNPKYARMQAVYPMFDIVEDEHEWLYEWGTVAVENGKAIMSKTKEQLLSDDDFLRLTFDEIKGVKHEFNGETYDFTQFETLEELLEYNKNKTNEKFKE